MHARPALSTHPPHPPTPPSSGCRSMPSSAADNSIILHAKTASDVLAQSASHLCEQITSYRKTDFIFEGRCLRYFFPAPSPPPSSLPREPSTPFIIFFSLPSRNRGPSRSFSNLVEQDEGLLEERMKGNFFQRCRW